MDYILPIATLIIGSAISYFTARANQKKVTAEVEDIYARLGIDKDKAKADSANTWMDVARKAAQEYERVLTENGHLKENLNQLHAENERSQKQISKMSKRISLLQARIRSLEEKKRGKR